MIYDISSTDKNKKFVVMIELDPTDYSIAVRRNRKPNNSTRAGKAALQLLVKLRSTLTLPTDGVARLRR